MKKTLKTLSPALAFALLLAGCASDSEETMESSMETSAAAPTPGTQGDFEQNGRNVVYFGFDKADLTPEAKGTVEQQAAWLKQYSSTKALVTGHCDPRGTVEYNLALGKKRADSVVKALEKDGVESNRLEMISKGKSEAKGTSEAEWSKERNATTEIK